MPKHVFRDVRRDPGPRHGRLRNATAAPHRELEALLEAASFFGSRDGYVLHLRAIASLYVALEDMLDDAGAVLARRITHLGLTLEHGALSLTLL